MQRNPNERVERREDYREAHSDVLAQEDGDIEEDEVYLDAEDYEAFEAAPPNTDVNFEEMAENYFARVDAIHQHLIEEDDEVLDFEDVSSEDDEPDQAPVLEALLRESVEPF